MCVLGTLWKSQKIIILSGKTTCPNSKNWFPQNTNHRQSAKISLPQKFRAKETIPSTTINKQETAVYSYFFIIIIITHTSCYYDNQKWKSTNINIPRIIWLHLLHFVCLFLLSFLNFSFNLSELLLQLRLWGSHLFYVDLGDWVPACIRVASFVTTGALTDPESHADRALMEFLADSFNVTWAMWIPFRVSAMIH